MREKILEFVKKTLGSTEQAVKMRVAEFKSDLEKVYGEELPAEPAKSIAIVEQSLIKNSAELEAKIAEACEQLLTDEDVDAILSYEAIANALKASAIGQRYDELQPQLAVAVAKCEMEWAKGAFGSVSQELTEIFAPPTSPEEIAPESPPAA